MSDSVYEKTICKLIQAKISSPRLEARLLIAAVANIQADEVTDAVFLSETAEQKLDMMIAERLKHKPLDKIIGHKAFYKYDFIVSENVLSPRPDTEILVMAAADLIRRHSVHSILDMGTGSGCILLSLLKDFPTLCGTGIDKSAAALKIARQNQVALNIPSQQAQFYQTDWFATDFMAPSAPFDMIVSNPPYIPNVEINLLDKEVKDYDPRLALDGGKDGLESYRRIAELSPALLCNGGFILLESGINQAKDIIEIFTRQPFEHLQTLTDLTGRERCIIFRKKDCI